jgi:hypothetical protein
MTALLRVREVNIMVKKRSRKVYISVEGVDDGHVYHYGDLESFLSANEFTPYAEGMIRRSTSVTGSQMYIGGGAAPWVSITAVPKPEPGFRMKSKKVSNVSFVNKGRPLHRSTNGRKPLPIRWAVVESRGMEDFVLSVHTKEDAAIKSMYKHGGGDGGRMNVRVVKTGEGALWEIIDLPWAKTIRPLQRRTNMANMNISRLANKLKR